MLKQFARDSAIYGAATLLVRGISFLLLPFYTRVLAPGDYGLVDLATVFTTLVMLTVALEISQGVARMFPDTEDVDARVAYASTALWFTVAAYAVFLLAAFPAASVLSELVFESGAREDLMRIVLVGAALTGVFYLLQQQLRWRLQPVGYTAAGLAYALISIAATVVLVVFSGYGVLGVLIGQAIGAACGAIVAFALARDLYRLRFDWAKLREMLWFSLPLVPSSVAVFVTLYIDRIAIKELMTITDVGLFGIGYRVASLVSLLMMAVQMAVTPLVYARHRDPQTPLALARLFRWFVGVALLVAIGLSLFAREILILVTTPDYYDGAVVIPLLAPALLLSAMYVFAPGLGIAKRTGLQAVITIGGAVLNTALNFALIPLWGIVGAAAATLISAAIVFAAYMVSSQRLYFVPHQWRTLAIGALLAAVVCAIGAWVELPLLPGLAVKVALGALSLAGVVALGLVDIPQLVAAVRAARGGSGSERAP